MKCDVKDCNELVDKCHLLCKKHQCEWNLMPHVLGARYSDAKYKKQIEWNKGTNNEDRNRFK